MRGRRFWCLVRLSAIGYAGNGRGIVECVERLGVLARAIHFATHAYASAKAATIAMSHAMAAQYASERHPGERASACTGENSHECSCASRCRDLRLSLSRKQPLSHGFLEAGDIAETALFLLSEKARHITGQVITVDGGWTL